MEMHTAFERWDTGLGRRSSERHQRSRKRPVLWHTYQHCPPPLPVLADVQLVYIASQFPCTPRSIDCCVVSCYFLRLRTTDRPRSPFIKLTNLTTT